MAPLLPFSEMPDEEVDVDDVEVLTSPDMLLFVRECVRDEAAETEAMAGGGGTAAPPTPTPIPPAPVASEGAGGGGTTPGTPGRNLASA